MAERYGKGAERQWLDGEQQAECLTAPARGGRDDLAECARRKRRERRRESHTRHQQVEHGSGELDCCLYHYRDACLTRRL